jgi:predicted nucleic acid-binding protein
MPYLFDSNILIYHLNGSLNDKGTDLLEEGLAGEGAHSVITKIELLGFSQSESDEAQGRTLLSNLLEIPLTSEIAEQTIQLRKVYKIKLPDAVIAATALVGRLTLVSRNGGDFLKIPNLIVINPFDN